MPESAPTLDAPRVRKDDERYEIVVDAAGTVAGYTLAVDHETADGVAQRIFPHTKVGDEFAGHGLASALVREALRDTIADGLRIVPVCPYVKAWAEKHLDEVRGHVDAPRPEHLRFLEEHAAERRAG